MRVIEMKFKDVDFEKFKRRTALESDCSELIREDVLITENGVPRILYKKINIDTEAMRWAVKTIPYSMNNRTGGIRSHSTLFGYMPRRTLRNDYCHAVSLAVKNPEQHSILCDFSAELAKIYQEFFPDILEEHWEKVHDKIKPAWQLNHSPFTSGIVNKNNPLKYHHDGGNFKGVLSNMIVFKNRVSGGHLACPEIDMMFEAADNSIVIFDGQSILHGVTPIKYLTPTAYRYSVVYYTLEQMWRCEDVNTELKRIRTVKKKREFKRLDLGKNSENNAK